MHSVETLFALKASIIQAGSPPTSASLVVIEQEGGFHNQALLFRNQLCFTMLLPQPFLEYFIALLITALVLPSLHTVATTTTPDKARSLRSSLVGNDAFSSAYGISRNITEISKFGIACFTQPAYRPRIKPIATVNDAMLL